MPVSPPVVGSVVELGGSVDCGLCGVSVMVVNSTIVDVAGAGFEAIGDIVSRLS